MPTTINSGVALVGAAKGSVPVALLMTVLSNSIGVLTVPFYLRVRGRVEAVFCRLEGVGRASLMCVMCMVLAP